MAMAEFMISDLQRSPKKVLSRVDRDDVILNRRGAPPLRLTLVGRDAQRDEAYAATARLLRNVLVHSPGIVSDALADAFPWVQFLPTGDRSVFAEELTRTLLATADLDTAAPVAQLLHEWRATAAIYADPKLAARLGQPVEPVTDQAPVSAP